MQVKIKMPDIADQKKYMGMSPQDQEVYIEQKVKDIVKLNPNGICIPDIAENTPFSRQTIIKHLERMVSSREAYKIRRRNFTTYYPNGRVVHPEYQEKIETGPGHAFRGTFLNNNYGEFVYIEDINNNSISGGSILISMELVDDFKDLINRLSKRKEDIQNAAKRTR